jgi:hypothetical protein
MNEIRNTESRDGNLSYKLHLNKKIVLGERLLCIYSNTIINNIDLNDLGKSEFANNITERNIKDFYPAFISKDLNVKILDFSQDSLENANRIINFIKKQIPDYDIRIPYQSFPVSPSKNLIYNSLEFKDPRMLWAGERKELSYFSLKNFIGVSPINNNFLKLFSTKLGKLVDISDRSAKAIINKEKQLRNKVDRPLDSTPIKRNKKLSRQYDEYDDGYDDDDDEYISEFDHMIKTKKLEYRKKLTALDKKYKNINDEATHYIYMNSIENLYYQSFGTIYKKLFPDNIFTSLSPIEKIYLKEIPNLKNIYYFTREQELQINKII